MFFVQYVQTQYFQLLISAKKSGFLSSDLGKNRNTVRKTGGHLPICAEKQAKPPFRRPFRLQRAQKKLPEQPMGATVSTA